MKAIRGISIAASISLTAALALADNATIGTSSGAGMNLGGSARVLAMGGAGTASIKEPAAIWVNPAQIGRLGSYELSLMHGVWVEDVAVDQISVALPAPYGRFGGAMTFLHMDEIESFDSLGRSRGTFAPNDMTVAVAYAFVRGPLACGASAKYIQSELAAGSKASAGAVDAGVSFSPIPDLTLSAAGLHVGGALEYDRESARLPATVRGGAAYRISSAGITLAADAVKPFYGDLAAHLGIEERIDLLSIVSLDLRGGWHSDSPRGSLAGAAAGCGVTWTPKRMTAMEGTPSRFGGERALPVKGVRIDYAWTPMGELGAAHWFSLLLSF